VFPAWYQTYWIRLVEILLGLGVIYAVIWFRTKRLRSQKVQLEIMVLDRVKELACANTELERLAHHDPLTGLGNRRRFFSKVSDHLSLAKRHHKPCCVMMVDLDNFKKVNDTFGHAGGDATLLASAKCLVSCVREIDVTARFGGEEFAVFFSGMDISNSREVAERFRQSLEALEIEFEGCIIRITASIGISDWKDNEAGIEPALDRADAALYRVKESGRNGIELA
jgi:diguanylate cyclase (GGDEF)-like protein